MMLKSQREHESCYMTTDVIEELHTPEKARSDHFMNITIGVNPHAHLEE